MHLRARSRGTALAIVLGLIMVLLAFGALLKVMTGGAHREVGTLSGHLRAVAVGEAAFAEIVARLASDGWPARWFAGGPAVETDRPTAGGRYSYVIRDVPPRAPAPGAPLDPVGANGLSAPRQADLMVKASYDSSSAVMFWRLALPDNSLDSLQRVIPVIFTFGPDDSPVNGGGVDAIGTLVDAMIAKRRANRPAVDAARRTLPGVGSAPEVAAAVGGTAAAPPLDTTDPLGGGPAVPTGARIGGRQAGLPPPAVPVVPGMPGGVPIPGTPSWPGWPARPPLPPPPPTLPPATPPATTPPPTTPPAPPAGYTTTPFDASVLDQVSRLTTWLRNAASVIKTGSPHSRVIADSLDQAVADMQSAIPGNLPSPGRTLSAREQAALDNAWAAVATAKGMPPGQGPKNFPPGP